MKLSDKIKPLLKNDKNKMVFIIAIFFLGAILLLFPSGEKKISQENDTFFDIEKIRLNEEKRLEKMLSMMKGVEEANVYISYKDIGTIDVVNEEKDISKKATSDNEIQTERKPIYNSDKNTVIKKLSTPTISGVCVFYKGDDSKVVREQLSRAVKGALGVEIYKIDIALLK